MTMSVRLKIMCYCSQILQYLVISDVNLQKLYIVLPSRIFKAANADNIYVGYVITVTLTKISNNAALCLQSEKPAKMTARRQRQTFLFAKAAKNDQYLLNHNFFYHTLKELLASPFPSLKGHCCNS